MESASFFPGAVRKVVIGAPSLLLGANKSRRIKLSIKMPLTGEAILGMPDWLGDAYTAVAKSFTEVEPQLQEIVDISLMFADSAPKDQLFENPSAKAPNSELRGFRVLRVGPSENPDVELIVSLYSNYSRDFWKWAGEKAGHEVHMYFPSTKTGLAVVPPPALPFIDDRPELDPSHDPEFELTNRTPTIAEEFGPEYHEQVAESLGVKGKRGRPKKSASVN